MNSSKNCEMKMGIKVHCSTSKICWLHCACAITYSEIHTYVMTHMNTHQRVKKIECTKGH